MFPPLRCRDGPFIYCDAVCFGPHHIHTPTCVDFNSNHLHPQRHALPRRQPQFDLEVSDMSATEDDTESFVHNRVQGVNHARPIDVASSFRPIQVKAHKQIANNLRGNDILILPPTITHLKIHTIARYDMQTTRAAVVGDVRLRDIVKQLLPESQRGEVEVYVKARGEWSLPGPSTKIYDFAEVDCSALNERRKAEIKVVVHGGREEDVRNDRFGKRGGEFGRSRGAIWR